MKRKEKSVSEIVPTGGSLKSNFKKYWPYYVLVLPGMIYFLMFHYVPMFGSVIAFQNYSVFKGVMGSKWVGFENFRKLFAMPDFYRILGNSLIFGFYKTILIFPIPIIFSLAINEIRVSGLKKTVQTAVYIPHFLSWVIVASIIFDVFGKGGLFNTVRAAMGLPTILPMQLEAWFRPIFIFSSIWKEAGWGTVVYLAALSGIDPGIYEAAEIDGASRFQRTMRITLPMLIPTMLTLFLLGIGKFLEIGFEQNYNLLTPMTQSVGDIFDTYVYRVGILNGQYSSTTAIGLFQAVVGLILVTTFNKIAKKTTDDGGLW
jgi:putative aldouronate transport system permease protein